MSVTFSDEQWLELCDILGIPAVDPDLELPGPELALRELRIWGADTHQRSELRRLLREADALLGRIERKPRRKPGRR